MDSQSIQSHDLCGNKEDHWKGWLSAGVHDTVRLGLNKWPYIDPFEDIDPVIETAIPETNLLAASGKDKEHIARAYSREFHNDNDEEADLEWDHLTQNWVHLTFFRIVVIQFLNIFIEDKSDDMKTVLLYLSVS